MICWFDIYIYICIYVYACILYLHESLNFQVIYSFSTIPSKHIFAILILTSIIQLFLSKSSVGSPRWQLRWSANSLSFVCRWIWMTVLQSWSVVPFGSPYYRWLPGGVLCEVSPPRYQRLWQLRAYPPCISDISYFFRKCRTRNRSLFWSGWIWQEFLCSCMKL